MTGEQECGELISFKAAATPDGEPTHEVVLPCVRPPHADAYHECMGASGGHVFHMVWASASRVDPSLN